MDIVIKRYVNHTLENIIEYIEELNQKHSMDEIKKMLPLEKLVKLIKNK